MHWFWRAMICVVGAAAFSGWYVAHSNCGWLGGRFFFLSHFDASFIRAIGGDPWKYHQWQDLIASSVSMIPCTLVVVITYFLTSQFFHSRETRCRKCNGTLRNLTIASCPSCGEAI
jgi:hypothetical protein